jgi:septum formation protein
MRIILGSQSPRRKEILGYFSLPFEQATSHYDEDAIPFCGDPHLYVRTLCEGKSMALIPHYPDAVIITADTIVYKDGKLYGKPRDAAHSHEILAELSGDWHTVYTGITVRKGQDVYTEVEGTRVLFNVLTKEAIQQYQEQLHCEDKAGSYLIQQAGSLIVKQIDGCFYNVMGLPINTLWHLLKKVDIDLWQHLKQ